MKSSISVRELAEFVHRTGDINRRWEGNATPEEGRNTQALFQSRITASNPNYQTERSLSARVKAHKISLRVAGRADGVVVAPSALVEEIKTTRFAPDQLHAGLGAAHMAQARLYAAMLCRTESLDSCKVQVTYVHPDTLASESFSEESPSADLESFLIATCKTYLSFLAEVLDRIKSRNEVAKDQGFPFEEVADEQLMAARRAYQSIRDSENLMLESPTGTGKTAATLYPSVKAMGEELIDRAVFVTARTTGQRIAVETLQALNADNNQLTATAITAKDRICFTPGAPCVPEHCEFADGHFDRVQNARRDLLKRRIVDREDVEQVARGHRVCPFELSLDVAEWSDVVIGDYTYVFDPLVALSRLRSRHFEKVSLLIDEAHRLGERVSDMLSVQLEERVLKAVEERSRGQAIQGPASQLIQMIDTLVAGNLDEEMEASVPSVPEELWIAANELLDGLLTVDIESTDDVLFECLNAIVRLTVAKDRFEPNSYVWIVSRTGDFRTLTLRCIAPGSWIRDVVKDFRSSMRFSGTLSPHDVYVASHGLQGPFRRVNIEPDHRRFGVMIVPDVSTYWRDRSDSAGSVASIVRTARDGAVGNWLVAFPSFEYINLVSQYFLEDEETREQQREMPISERSEFIGWISQGSRRVAFVTMGGIFTESVDIDGDVLAGVIVIGPAIPPSSLERELIRDTSELGYELAYRQPALTRVVQAAGRVVRGPADRGAIILVDPRFTHREVQQYFPSHWDPEVVRCEDLGEALSRFSLAI